MPSRVVTRWRRWRSRRRLGAWRKRHALALVPDVERDPYTAYVHGEWPGAKLPAIATPLALSSVLQPDADAFIGGVVIGLSVALLVVGLLGGLAIVRRIVGA